MAAGYGDGSAPAQPVAVSGRLSRRHSRKDSAMQLPHNAAVLVADGRKLLFLRNEGDDAYPNLVVEQAEMHLSPADHDQKSDSPGRAASSVGGGRSTMDETDFHQLEEDRFAAEAADLLRHRVLAHDVESLIIVAPPHTLGEMRKHYHSEVSARIVGEIDKDLTGRPIPAIESAIKAA
jgi:protein required for attachment to host cells